MGFDIKLRAEAGGSGSIAPVGNLGLSMRYRAAGVPERCSWLWGQSGLLHAAHSNGSRARALCHSVFGPGRQSWVEGSPLVAAAGRGRHREADFMPFVALQDSLGMYP